MRMRIHEYLKEGYAKWRNKPYIHTKQGADFHAITYGRTAEDVWAMAAAMQELGLQGAGVLYAGNSYEWMVINLALMGYTGRCVPIDSTWTAFDLKNCLERIPASVFFYGKQLEAHVVPLYEQYPETRFYCIEEAFTELLEIGRRAVPASPQIDTAQTVQILFTSGTTSLPKAIPLSQANLFANWETLYQRTPMTEADRSYIFLPLNYVYSGVANFLYSIISGMELYLCRDLNEILPDMLEIRPTVVCTVPVILQRIYAALQTEERILSMLREIRYLYCGGSFTDPALKSFFREKGVALLEAYGTTETSSVIALECLDDANLESNGVVFENLQVEIACPDENGVGEVCVKGGSVSEGYLDLKDRACSFQNGFYHTGDLGCIDANRRLYIKGRLRRTVDLGNGKNIYADELEELLLQYPEIHKATVYARDQKLTASVYAEMNEAGLADIIGGINQKLPRYKQIRAFELNNQAIGSWYKQ